jgi:hypothetical protein
MGSGRSESAEDAPKRGAFPAGLIGAEPIDLAAVRQGERFFGQVTEILKDFTISPVGGQNHPRIMAVRVALFPRARPRAALARAGFEQFGAQPYQLSHADPI